jgi:hypothetical protein
MTEQEFNEIIISHMHAIAYVTLAVAGFLYYLIRVKHHRENDSVKILKR